MVSRNNLRLVSFDGGGGARTLSQLQIMGTIMHRLKHDRYPNDLDKIMLPCDHFDLMGGSGTGGLVAVMLSKLRMSIEEASAEFFKIVEEVYEPDNLTPSERTGRLRECMEILMNKKGLPVDLELRGNIQEGRCACLVTAGLRASATSKVTLRSYSVRSQLPSSITVIDAVLATCAVQPGFTPVSSGSGHKKTDYIAAGLGTINPVRDVITGALELFDSESSVAFLLSLGAGKPGVIPVPLDGQVDLHGLTRIMMDDCERRAEEIERQIGTVGIYFRFSVEQGMQNNHLNLAMDASWIGQPKRWLGAYFGPSVEQGTQSRCIGEAMDPSWIAAQATIYVSDASTSRKIDALLQNFDTVTEHITLNQLEYVGGASVSAQSNVTLDIILAATDSIRNDTLLAKLKPQSLECGPQVAECMEGTRRDILANVMDWTTDVNAPNILWLKGYPGVGKSAIATSIVERLRDMKRLGSSFFFQRQEATVMTPISLWRMVAYTLAGQYPTVGTRIIAALKADESILTTVNVEKLFQQLIHGPLMASEDIPAGRLPIVVIDALDECGGLGGQYSKDRSSLIKTLRIWSSLPLKFKLVVTSRGEVDIERLFSATNHTSIEILAGQRVEAQSSKDIQIFLADRIQQQIADRYENSLPPGWPGTRIIENLAGRAAGLFIWAETVVNFISIGQPQQRLNQVLNGSGTGDMEELYEEVLRTSFPRPTEEEVKNFRSVVGAIILAKEPLSFATLQSLLSLEAPTVKHICNGLQSVLESRHVLQFHHQSFVDFLIDSGRNSSKFFIDREQENRTLTLACLRAMREGLRFNICGFTSSYVRNADVLDLESRVKKFIPPHLSYSSCFWASHLAESAFHLDVFKVLRYFMETQFLFWLEVLSCTKRVHFASSMLVLLIDWIKAGQRDDAMARDMRKFVAAFANVISQSATHIYLSALPFSPRNSMVSKQYRRHHPRTLAIEIGGLTTWPVNQIFLNGNCGLVSSVALSPDGRRIASGTSEKMIQVWDAETGEVVAGPFKGHNGGVNSIAFSPDGSRIVSGSYDWTVRVWDVETGEVVAGPFKGHSGWVNSVAFSPDGTRIISGSYDHTIRMWDSETGEAIVGPLDGHSGAVSSVAFSPDGSRIVSGSFDSTIRLWDAETGEMALGPLHGHSDSVKSVTFSPNGSRVVSGSFDHTIRVWNAKTGEMVAGPFNNHSGHVNSVAYSPDGKRIVSGSDDTAILVWDAETGKVVAGPLSGHTGAVSSVLFLQDGGRIVSGSFDRTIRVWDAETNEVVTGAFKGHSDWVNSVAFSPNGNHIVSGSQDWTIWVWDAETGEAVSGPFKGHSDRVTTVAFSPDGSRIISGSNDRTIRVWDAKTGEVVAGPFNGHTAGVNSVAFSPDGNRIVSGAFDDTIRVWDAKTGEVVAGPFNGHTACLYSVAFSPDRNRIIFGSYDKTVRIWNAKTGQLVSGPFKGHSSHVNSVAFSPNGKRIVSGSYDWTIRVWDAETGEAVSGPFKGHSDRVTTVAFSPDGNWIISGSSDRTIRVWDAKTGEVVAGPFNAHTAGVNSVAFSPDGSRIVSGSLDSTLRVWDVRTGNSKHGTPVSPFTDSSEILNGWIMGPNSELLFWVPPTLRGGLFRPNTRLIIGDLITTKLDLNRFVHGESWSECKG